MLAWGLAGCSSQDMRVISVHNALPVDRTDEMVEVDLDLLECLDGLVQNSFFLTDEEGTQVPYQLTYDRKLLFPATVAPGATARYCLHKGIPAKVDTVACGRYYAERADDIAWENDKAAYRAYGPALQRRGERAYGYDVFTKSVPYPVVEERYKRELNPDAWAEIKELQAAGKKQEADSLIRIISYHVDHGNGMDCYSVGPTLGGGTAALMVDSALVYPYCYKEYEILDNGPLRFTVKLVFHPQVVGRDSSVVETRIISLDKGTYFNRTQVSYSGLSASLP